MPTFDALRRVILIESKDDAGLLSILNERHSTPAWGDVDVVQHVADVHFQLKFGGVMSQKFPVSNFVSFQ